MGRRLLTAAILLSIVLGGFYFPVLRPLLMLAIALIAIFCTLELADMLRHKQLRVYRRVASWGVIALMIEAYFSQMTHSMLVFGSAVCLALLVRMRYPVAGAWADVSATVFTLAYVGIPMAALVRIFEASSGARAWLLTAMAVIWTTDSFALFGGKLMGRTKLSPKVSPGKTWEGAMSGVAGALLVVLVARAGYPQYFGTSWSLELAFFAVLFAILGQCGDLVESLLKRDIGVKDSGSKLTGHGGFLDLMDALLFCAIPLLVYLHLTRPEVLNIGG